MLLLISSNDVVDEGATTQKSNQKKTLRSSSLQNGFHIYRGNTIDLKRVKRVVVVGNVNIIVASSFVAVVFRSATKK